MKILKILSTRKALEIGRFNKKNFIRKSPLNFENLSNFLIFREGKTNQMDLYNFFNKKENNEISVTKSALTEQRKKLNPEIFEYMNQEYVKSRYDEVAVKTISGTNLIAAGIDGSVFEIPNKEELKNSLGYISNSSDVNAKVTPRAQVSGVYDCCNNIMIQAKIAEYSTSEKELAKQHIIYVKEFFPEQYNEMLFIFDRGYIGIPLLLFLEANKGKYLFRLSKTVYKKEISEMTTNDEIVSIPLTKSRIKDIKDPEIKKIAEIKEEIKVRIVKVTLDTGETEILLTNIPKEQIDTNKMKEVYFLRWNIELSYDKLKNKLQIESFSGHTKLAVEQDFHAQILLYNMLEDIKSEANETIANEHKNNTKKYKYEYIVNMNILVGLAKNYLLAMAITDDLKIRNELGDKMLKYLKKNLIAVKPGRKNIRCKFGIKNKYTTNMKRSI